MPECPCIPEYAEPYKPPRLCAKYLDAFSGKQRKVSSFFTSKKKETEPISDTNMNEELGSSIAKELTVIPKQHYISEDIHSVLSSKTPQINSRYPIMKKVLGKREQPPQRKLTDFYEKKPRTKKVDDAEDQSKSQVEKFAIDSVCKNDNTSSTHEAWAALWRKGPKPPPACYHGESCKEMTGKLNRIDIKYG